MHRNPVFDLVRFAHGGGVPDYLERFIVFLEGDGKNRILPRLRLVHILPTVHHHVVVVGAAPHQSHPVRTVLLRNVSRGFHAGAPGTPCHRHFTGLCLLAAGTGQAASGKHCGKNQQKNQPPNSGKTSSQLHPVHLYLSSFTGLVTFTLWSYHFPFVPIRAQSNSLSISGTGTSKA